MTEATITMAGILILAVLAVVYKVLDYTNKTLMPEVKTLMQNVSDLNTAHALNRQQIEQNTARLNGQSAKIDTLLINSPGPAPAANPVDNTTRQMSASLLADLSSDTPAPLPAPVKEAPANLLQTSDAPGAPVKLPVTQE